MDRKTKKFRCATEKDLEAMKNARSNAEGLRKKVQPIMEDVIEKQEVEKAAEKELNREREIALENAGTFEQQEAATKNTALGRKVEAIDGQTGQETERAAAAEMEALLNKGPEPETGSQPLMQTPNQNATDEIAREHSLKALSNIKTKVKNTQMDIFETVKKAQEDAIDQAKTIAKDLLGQDKKENPEKKPQKYTLAEQDENEIKGVGSDVAKLKKQRDSLARELSCEERCKLLYETSFICNNGDCLCENGEDYKIQGKCDQFHLNPGEA